MLGDNTSTSNTGSALLSGLATPAMCDWLIAKGVHGLYPNGSTGEFTRFTPEERRRIVAIMAELSGEQRARLARLCRRLLRVLDPDQANEPADEAHADAQPDEQDEHDDDSDDALDVPAVETTLPSPT